MKIKHLIPRQIKYPIKIMWISNSIHLPSGFAKVSKSICTRLAKNKDFKIYTIGMQHSGKIEEIDGIINMGISQGKVFESIQTHINSIVPDVVIILEDPFTMVNNKFHELNIGRARLLLYVCMDGNNAATNVIPIHRQADLNIGMAKFTTEQLKEIGFDNSITIWHGIEHEQYKPVSKKVQSKIKLLNGYKENDILFYSFFRNSGRKAPQTHMEIMADTLSELPVNYKYIIHSINANDTVNDLFDFRDRVLKDKYGEFVTNRIIISYNTLSEEQMIQNMQMADYIIHASTGGGFELLLGDAMSCGKICIANDFSTTYELLIEKYDNMGERGIAVPYQYLLTSSYNVEHGHSNKELFKQTILDTLNMSQDEKNILTTNARTFIEKYLTWDIIVKQFEKEIYKVI